MRPYITRVCGFDQTNCGWAHKARVWYPITDLLHLRNDVLIGYACIARGENLCFYENLYTCVQKHELCSYNIPHLLTNEMK